MVERSLSMREVPGSIPGASNRPFGIHFQIHFVLFFHENIYIIVGHRSSHSENLIILQLQSLHTLKSVSDWETKIWRKCVSLQYILSFWQRPYHVEHTSSRPITEVKQHWARLVLGWVTAWEHRVLLSFYNSTIFLSFIKLIIKILISQKYQWNFLNFPLFPRYDFKHSQIHVIKFPVFF